MSSLLLLSIIISLTQAALLGILGYKNRMATIIGGLLTIHTVITLFTAVLGILTYPMVVGLHLVTLACLLYATKPPIKRVLYQLNVISTDSSPDKGRLGGVFTRTKPPSSPLSSRRPFGAMAGAAGGSDSIKHIDWLLLALIIITPLFLGSVHYSYDGLVSQVTSNTKTQVNNFVYPYPYFSDEWYSVALAKQTIIDQGLPKTNPLVPNSAPIYDLEASFHLLISELLLFFDLDPLKHYTAVSVAINSLIVVMIYGICRKLPTRPIAAFIAAVSALFITNSANLPGLWNLLAISVGTLALLTSISFLQTSQRWHFLATTLLALLYYPPLVVISVPILLIHMQNRNWLYQLNLMSTDSSPDKGRLGGVYIRTKPPSSPLSGGSDSTKLVWLGLYASSGIAGIAVVVLLMATQTIPEATQKLSQLWGTIWYPSFTSNAMPHYPIWHIVPVATLLAAMLGLLYLRKRTGWLGVAIAIGLCYWTYYHFYPWRLVIEYQRVIFITSLCITILAALGWQKIVAWLFIAAKAMAIPAPRTALALAAVIITLSLWPTYTATTNWQKLALHDQEHDRLISPAAPANTYLQPADLALFADISSSRLVAPPWKGTVIGVAQSLHPLVTKGGTITINPDLFTDFLLADCTGRGQLARRFAATHIYAPAFTCPEFTVIGEGSENLWLYQFTPRPKQPS